MQGFVSSRRYGGLALIAALSVVFVACSIFIPYGFPWMALGWVGMALAAALWVRIRSARSLDQVLRDVDAEAMPTVAARSGPAATRVGVHVAWLSFLAVSLLAGARDPAANLSACKSGGPSCDRSRLTLVETTEVANAEHARNVSSCRNGASSSDKSTLTGDRSRLSPGEAASIPREVR